MSTHSHFIRIAAAAFDQLPERHVLAEAAEGLAEIDYHKTTASLAARIARCRPAMLILPTADARGLPMAATAAECMRQVPDTLVALLVTRKAGMPRCIPDALRSGGAILSVASAADLREFLVASFGRVKMTETEMSQMQLVLANVEPALFRAALVEATRFAHERLTVQLLASRLRMRPATLSRHLADQHLPGPGEAITWGRLLRASVASWRNEASLQTLARIAGFTDPLDLRRACQAVLGIAQLTREQLMPSRVAAALRGRLGSRFRWESNLMA